MRQKNQTTNSRNYQCEVCGMIMPIARRRANEKEFHHIKDLYCTKCKKETPHVEKPDYISGDLMWKFK